MEASFAAGALLHPISLLILALIMFAGVKLGADSSSLSWRRLLGGFAGVLLASLIVAAASAYVSPEDAVRFGVHEEHYVGALARQFLVLAVLCGYVSIVGCAAVGLPVTLALAKRGFATAPFVVLASLPISLAVLVPMGLMFGMSAKHVAQTAPYLLLGHVATALGFALGARLPWQFKCQLVQ